MHSCGSGASEKFLLARCERSGAGGPALVFEMNKRRRAGTLVVVAASLVIAWTWLWQAGVASIPLLARQNRIHIGGGWFLVYLDGPLAEPSASARLIWQSGVKVHTLVRYPVSHLYLGQDCLAFGYPGATGSAELHVACAGKASKLVAKADFPFDLTASGTEVANLRNRERVVERILSVEDLTALLNEVRGSLPAAK